MRSQDKIIVVTRRTRLQELTQRFNNWSQAKFFVKHMNLDPSDYEVEHETYQASLNQVLKDLGQFDRKVVPIDRGFLPNYLFADDDFVVTVGQDGLVVNTAKYLNGQPIVAVNPDAKRFDGILLPYSPRTAASGIERLLRDAADFAEITMAEARLNDGQSLLAFNDFLIGCRTHVSARYSLTFNGNTERQSSSGVLVSTGAGSTGWLSSTRNMAAAVSNLLCDKPVNIPPLRLKWDDPRLAFVVREPFASKWSGVDLAAGLIEPGSQLTVESHMPEGGVIFSDGIEADALAFGSGIVATIQTAQRRTRLVMADGQAVQQRS